jgi:hypothetical protein
MKPWPESKPFCLIKKEILMLTLTVAEIKDLAECAGLVLRQDCLPDADELETELTIVPCPESGVLDDDGKATHFAHLAYVTDSPDEGSFPLGTEIQSSAETTGPVFSASMDSVQNHPEVNMAEVLKQRAAAGQPIYVMGALPGGVLEVVKQAATPAGQPEKSPTEPAGRKKRTPAPPRERGSCD